MRPSVLTNGSLLGTLNFQNFVPKYIVLACAHPESFVRGFNFDGFLCVFLLLFFLVNERREDYKKWAIIGQPVNVSLECR